MAALKWYLSNSLGNISLPPVCAGSEFNNNRLGFESQPIVEPT